MNDQNVENVKVKRDGANISVPRDMRYTVSVPNL
jgi:hypothetical protein